MSEHLKSVDIRSMPSATLRKVAYEMSERICEFNEIIESNVAALDAVLAALETDALPANDLVLRDVLFELWKRGGVDVE